MKTLTTRAAAVELSARPASRRGDQNSCIILVEVKHVLSVDDISSLSQLRGKFGYSTTGISSFTDRPHCQFQLAGVSGTVYCCKNVPDCKQWSNTEGGYVQGPGL